MNVLIVDGLHDSDRGGAGIVAGLIDALYEVSEEAKTPIRIGLVYRYSATDEKFSSAARHTHPRYPDLTIYAKPVRTHTRHRGILKKLDFLRILAGAIFILVLPRLGSSDTIRAMQESDFVIGKGGHFFQSHLRNPAVGFVHTFLSAYNLLLAIRLQKPYALVAHSVGPLENFASRGIVKYIFSKASFLSTREEISKAILVRMGIEASRIEVVPDTAFVMTPAPRVDLEGYLNRKGLADQQYAIITARYWDFPALTRDEASKRYKDYLNTLADTADHIVDQGYAGAVLLVVHNDGRHLDFEDDAKPVREIHAAMRNKQKAVVIDDDLPPSMQAALYGRAIVTIGTRMHSVIFALVAGGAAIAVAYNHKTDGMMDLLGLGQYALPIDSIDSASAAAMIREVLDNRTEVVRQAQSRIVGFRVIIKEILRRTVFQA